ncbi:MAG: AAA family ATPase [Candidatus Eremiobacteraeota bacterium]|nr:AAA family ATPase [Candidatus Eremiobacteraeota bacterium]
MRTAHLNAGASAPLRIRLFGTPQFFVGDDPWRFAAPPKTLPLLAYLIVRRDKSVSRQTVAFALWPDDDEPAARANLRRHLHYLQASFPQADDEKPWILMDGRTAIQWNVNAPCNIDVEAFERLSRNDELLEEAIALYTGDLLEDITDDSIESDRQRLRDLQALNLSKLVAANRRDHKLSAALAFAQRLIALDPWREDVVRTIMELRYAIGDRAGAIAEFNSFAERSMNELHAAPMAETQACHESIVRGTLLIHEARSADSTLNADEPRQPRPVLPFFGRESELGALQSRWKQAVEGCGNFALVAGEAGIGKTRLLAEFARVVESEGARVLRGGAAFNDPVPYEPLVGALREALPIITASRIDAIWLAALATLIPKLRQHRSGVAELPTLDAAQERQRLFEAFARVIDALSRERPVLLILEDLHWTGSATIDLLQYVAEHTASMHVLIVATYRIEETMRTHPLRKLSRMLMRERKPLQVSLAPFSQQSVRELVGKLAEDELVLRDNIDLLYERSQGSPLFLTELIRDLRDRGDASARERALTVGLQGIVEERLARLSDDARSLANIAAVAGTPFDIELLRELNAWDEERSMSGLNELLDRHVLREAASNQTGAYAFSHHLIESAVYENVSGPRLKHIHQRAALVMEELYADRIDDFAQRIAYHFERSNTPRKAVQYYERAARAALAVFAYDDVVAFANEGLELAEDPTARVNLLLLRERADAQLGHGEARSRDIEELVQLVQECSDSRLVAEVLMRRIEFNHFRSHREDEISAIEQLRSLAQANGMPAHFVKALQAKGRYFTLLLRFQDAESTYRQALDLSIEVNDVRAQIETRCYLADLYERRGEFQHGEAELSIARRQSSEREEPARRLPILYSMARLLNYQKRADELLTTADEMLEIASHVGDRYFEATASNIKGIVLSNRFQFSECEVYLNRALALFDAMMHEPGGLAVLNNQAVVAMRLGNASRTLDLFGRIRERGLRANLPLNVEMAAIGSSAACLRAGDVQQAFVYAHEAVGLTSRTGSQNRGMAFDILGQAEMEAGNHAQAQEYFGQAIALMRAPEFEALAADVYANLALANLLAGDNEEALRNVERFMPALTLRGDEIEEPERLYFISAQVYRANGNEELASRNIARAHEIFRGRLESIEAKNDRETYAAIAFHRDLVDAYRQLNSGRR